MQDDRLTYGRHASLVGIACNVALAAAKGAAGLAVHSVSLVADAVNNLTDAASNVVTLAGFKLAEKPADEGHPYGHGRMEYLAGLAVAVMVIVAGAELVQLSAGRIMAPAAISYTLPSILSLVASMFVKTWLAYYNHRVGERIGSKALEAASADSRNDVLASGAVLAGAAIGHLSGVQLDGWLGLGVGLFVTWNGIALLRETANPLLGNRPDPELVERVRRKILSYPGVLGTHDLMIHDYGPGHMFASAHVEMAAEADPMATHDVIDQIERDLRQTEGLATILHYDPIATNDTDRADLRSQVLEAVTSIDAGLSVHDLHAIHEPDRLVLSFDCVRTPECSMDDEALTQRIVEEVRRILPHAECHVTIDAGFVSPTS